MLIVQPPVTGSPVPKGSVYAKSLTTLIVLILSLPCATGHAAPIDLPPTAPPPAPAHTETPPVVGGPGVGVTMTGDRFSLNVRSRIQIRYQLEVPPENAEGERLLQQTVNIGTARLWLSGFAFDPKFTYMIQLALAGRDYRDNASSPIFDAYVDWRAHRDLNVRAGQFFVPFDRLRTIREWGLQMPDRPRPVTEMTLDRDVGAVLYSERFLSDSSPVAWRLGAFGGGGTNLTRGKEPGVLAMGRLELRPLGPIDDDVEGDIARRQKPGLAIGAALATNINTNRLRSTTGPTFAGGTTTYNHAAIDAVFKWRGIALQAEYLWKESSRDQILSSPMMGMPLVEYTRSGRGYVLQASYVFETPIEFVGRLTRMYASAGTDPSFVRELERGGREVAGGINYYFNNHRFKFQADWVLRTPPSNFLGTGSDQLVHAQLDATF